MRKNAGRNVFLVWVGVLVFGHLLLLNVESLPLPILGRTVTELVDFVLLRLQPTLFASYGNFNERFSVRAWPIANSLRAMIKELHTESWGDRLQIPALGEPIEIPAMLRSLEGKEAVETVSLSQGIIKNDMLFQRIYEGIYPRRVVAEGRSSYFLKLREEVEGGSGCITVSSCREALLVRCP